MPVPGLFNALYAREIDQSRYFKGFGGQYEPALTDKKVPRYVKTGVMLKAYDGREKALDYTYKILDHLFVSEVADWSVVFDVAHRTVHFKTSLNRTIKRFALDSFDFSNGSPTQILDIDIKAGGEVAGLFTPYSHDKMAQFVASLPLPKAFCEMGGLKLPEFIERLARHTTKAEDQKNQPFLGTWQTKTKEAGEVPRWQLTLHSQGDLVSGEITNAKDFVVNTPIEQIRLVGQELAFTFRSKEEKVFIFAKARLDEASSCQELGNRRQAAALRMDLLTFTPSSNFVPR
jgi:choloylglycine hydrolase